MTRSKYGSEFALQSQYFDLAVAGAAEITAIATFEVIEPGSYGRQVAFGPVADRGRARYFHVLLHSAARPRR